VKKLNLIRDTKDPSPQMVKAISTKQLLTEQRLQGVYDPNYNITEKRAVSKTFQPMKKDQVYSLKDRVDQKVRVNRPTIPLPLKYQLL
jgi:hypothetical protein